MLNRALIVVGIALVASWIVGLGAQADPGTPAILYVIQALLAAFVVLAAAAVVRGLRP